MTDETGHVLKTRKRLLITGCARSGTRYITFLLRRLGLDVGHERMGRDGIASWPMAVEADRVPWGPSWRDYVFDHVFQQVRNPIDVIRASLTLKENSWAYISRSISCSLADPPIVRAAKYWYYWNKEAESIADWRYRIEDLPNVFTTFCDCLGIDPKPELLDSLPRDINTRRYGRRLHLLDEFLEQIHVEPNTWLRNRLKSPKHGHEQPIISWQVLESLDSKLCDAIASKAMEYGYTVS